MAGNYFWAVLALCVAVTAAQMDLSLPKAFENGMKQIEIASKHLDSIFGMASRVAEEDASVAEDSSEEDDDIVDRKAINFPLFSFLGGQRKNWWDGENVCITKKTELVNSSNSEGSFASVFIVGKAHFQSCQAMSTKYVCSEMIHEDGVTNTTETTYKCCHGYTRNTKGLGCKQVELKPVLDIADEQGADKFVSLVKSTGNEVLFNKENSTVFVPSNEAMEKYQHRLSSNEGELNEKENALESNDVLHAVNKRDNSAHLNRIVKSHIVPEIVERFDFTNDLVLKTEANTTLRVNVYSGNLGPLVTVNCARVNSTDMTTETGVLHTVESVLEPVNGTLLDILSSPEYSTFSQALSENGLMEKLEGPGPLTIFALDNGAMEKLSHPKYKKCYKKILQHHILGHTVCSAAATDMGFISARDLAGDWVRLNVDNEGNLVIDKKVPAISRDQLATNGVLHNLIDVAIPGTAESPVQILRQSNHTLLVSLLQKADLVDFMETLDKLIMFVPTKRSLASLEEELNEMPVERLRDLLMFHMTNSDVSLRRSSYIPMMLKDASVHLAVPRNIFSGVDTSLQCIPLVDSNTESCNGVLQLINGVLRPPNSTLFEMIQTREEFDGFKTLLQGTKLEEELKKGFEDKVTLLVPSPSSILRMSREKLDSILKDKDLSDKILRNHIIAEPICCSSVETSLWPGIIGTERLRTHGGLRIPASRNRNYVSFNNVRVKQCDTIATDGIIHLMDDLITGGDHKTTSGDREIIVKRPQSDIILRF